MVGWDFFDSRRQRYGPILRTHLFGRPVVRVSSGEFVRQILIKEHNIIDSAYPTSVRVSSSVDAVSCCFQPAELVSVGNLVMRKTYSMRHVSDMVLFSFDECNTQSYYTYTVGQRKRVIAVTSHRDIATQPILRSAHKWIWKPTGAFKGFCI